MIIEILNAEAGVELDLPEADAVLLLTELMGVW